MSKKTFASWKFCSKLAISLVNVNTSEDLKFKHGPSESGQEAEKSAFISLMMSVKSYQVSRCLV